MDQLVPREQDLSSVDSIIVGVKVMDGIFLGGAAAARLHPFIQSNRITHVVNCSDRNEIPNCFAQYGLNYFNLHWTHDESQTLFDPIILQRFLDFFADADEQSACVLIHSYDGKRRAVAAAVTLLVARYRFTVRDAIIFMSYRIPPDVPESWIKQLEPLEPDSRSVFDPILPPGRLDEDGLALRNTLLNQSYWMRIPPPQRLLFPHPSRPVARRRRTVHTIRVHFSDEHVSRRSALMTSHSSPASTFHSGMGMSRPRTKSRRKTRPTAEELSLMDPESVLIPTTPRFRATFAHSSDGVDLPVTTESSAGSTIDRGRSMSAHTIGSPSPKTEDTGSVRMALMSKDAGDRLRRAAGKAESLMRSLTVGPVSSSPLHSRKTHARPKSSSSVLPKSLSGSRLSATRPSSSHTSRTHTPTRSSSSRRQSDPGIGARSVTKILERRSSDVGPRTPPSISSRRRHLSITPPRPTLADQRGPDVPPTPPPHRFKLGSRFEEASLPSGTSSGSTPKARQSLRRTLASPSRRGASGLRMRTIQLSAKK